MDPPRETSVAQSTYKRDSDYSLQLNRWFLKPIGAWPKSDDTSIAENVLSRLLNLLCTLIIAFTVVPCFLYIILGDEDTQLKLKAFGPMNHWLMGGLNYSSLLLHRKDIRRCVEHMETDWRIVERMKDRETMLKNAKFGRYVASFAAFVMQFGVFSYSILTSMPVEVHFDNETIRIHPVPCPPYRELIDIRKKPTNEIVLAMQFLSCFLVNSITSSACSLAAVFAMHASGQLNVLMEWLNEFVEDVRTENQIARVRMAVIVKHHLRVLSFISYIEDIMHQICLVELVGCTVDICMLGYYSITEWADHDVKTLITYFVIFISLSFNIFIFCFIGEILTEQCRKVGESAYMTKWYRLPNKTALDLILIISRSSVVSKITAGKLVHLSVATFGDVIRTSLAYLNILRTMTT